MGITAANQFGLNPQEDIPRKDRLLIVFNAISRDLTLVYFISCRISKLLCGGKGCVFTNNALSAYARKKEDYLKLDKVRNESK
jgi:hypothetical protein